MFEMIIEIGKTISGYCLVLRENFLQYTVLHPNTMMFLFILLAIGSACFIILLSFVTSNEYNEELEKQTREKEKYLDVMRQIY